SRASFCSAGASHRARRPYDRAGELAPSRAVLPPFERHSLLTQLVPDRDFSTLHHLAINAAIGVTECPHQRVRDREVANAGVGVDVCRRTAHDALDDPEPRPPGDRDLLAE